MKKLFLLTSIILFTFGFSLNSNIVNNSSENKNDNNIEQTNLETNTLSENDPYLKIIYDNDIPKGIVTPTTASVDYIYANKYDIREKNSQGLVWTAKINTSNNYSDIGSKSLDDIYEEDKKESSDYDYYYEGTIRIENLKYDEEAPTKYKDSYLSADYNVPYSGDETVESTRYDFSAPILKAKAKTENINFKTSTDFNEATVEFDFTPSTKEYIYWDEIGKMRSETKDIPVIRVDWVGENENDILGSITGEELTYEGGKYSGEIVIDDYMDTPFIPNETYKNTKLIIYDEFAVYEDYEGNKNLPNDKYLYESAPFDFTIKDDPCIKTEVSEHEILLDPTGFTTATMNYEVDPGTDSFGNPLEVKTITWEEAEDSKNEPLRLVFEEPDSVDEDGIATGTLSANDILPGKTYDTQLRIDFKENNDANPPPYPSYIEQNTSFTTKDKKVEGEIVVTSKPNEEDGTLDKTMAEVSYDLTPYKINGEEQQPKTIKWNSDQRIMFTEANPPTSGEGSLKVTNLTPGTPYTNNELVVDYGDDHKYTSSSFDFETVTGEDEGDVSTGEDEKGNPTPATVTGPKSAEIDYNLTPAKDNNGKNINPSKIAWFDPTREEELASNEGEAIGTSGGTLEATNLDPNTTYENTYLIVTDSEGTYNSKEGSYESGNGKQAIPNFTTEAGNTTGIVSSGEEATNIGAKTATVTYTIDHFATNKDGSDISPNKIAWVDPNRQEELASNEGRAIGTSGELTATNLVPGETYTDTYLIVTNPDKSAYNSKDSPEDGKSIKEFTTESYSANGTVTSTKDIKTEEKGDSTSVDYTIKPALDDEENPNTIEKITWMNEEGTELGGKGHASLESEKDEIPEPDKITGLVSGRITANLPEKTTYNNTYLVVKDNKDGIYNKCEIGTFSNRGVNKLGEVNSIDNSLEYSKQNPKIATIDYEITLGTDGSETPIATDKITWVEKVGEKEIELGGEGNASITSPDDNGTLQANNLTPGTEYIDTYLVVEDKEGNVYRSTDEGKDPICDFSTKDGDRPGEITKVGEIVAKGSSATITYNIEAALNVHGGKIETENVKWMANVKKVDGSTELITLAEEAPVNHYEGNGTMTAYNLPINAVYADTYLVMEGDFVDSASEESTHFELETGNYKTKKMIIGGTVLGAVIIILAIISFFAYEWWKRRSIN